jgi:hypothetical protein
VPLVPLWPELVFVFKCVIILILNSFLDEAFIFIRKEGTVANEEIIMHFGYLDAKFADFLSKLETENERTRAAFHLLVQSALENRQLTPEEKKEIEEQLKELLKTADLVALTVLPGGSVVLILSTFLKLNSYIVPSVFLKQPEIKN